MAASEVQYASSHTYGTTLSVNWPSTPTLGNTLIAIVAGRDVLTSLSGWTLIEQDSYAGQFYVDVYYKIAEGDEVSVEVEQASSKPFTLAITEYSGLTATPLDKSAIQLNYTGIDGTTATATTSATTQDQELVLGVAASRQNDYPAEVTLSSGYTDIHSEVDMDVAWGIKDQTSTGTQSAVVTSPHVDYFVAFVATFKVQVAAPASTLIRDAVAAGYAASIGHVGEPTAAQLINPAAFVAALRAGWTIGEAMAVASPIINSNLRMIGDPLARILLPLQGYNIYSRPVLDAVDELIAVAPAGATEYVAQDFDPGSSQIISVRAVNRLGREDDEALHARLASFDDAGELNAQTPNPVIDLQLTNVAGTVTARWMYRANGQVTAPDHYAIYTAVDGAAFDYGTPDYTLTHASRHVHEISIGSYSDGQQLRVAVETVDAAGGASPRRFAEISIDAAAPDDPQSIDVEVTNE